MVFLRVCWRAGKSLAPPVSTFNLSDSLPSKASGGSILIRAAASSMASGSPSSLAHISATAGAFLLVTLKPALAACARSMKRRTASYCVSLSALSEWLSRTSGTDSGGTAYSCSP